MTEAGLAQFRFRQPWYLLGLIALAAILGTIAVAGAVRVRVGENTAQADFVQSLELQKLSLRVDDLMSDAAQLTYAAATGPCSVRQDRALVRQLLDGLLRARTQRRIFGLGCFFEPRVFDARSQFFGPYIHEEGAHQLYLTNTDGTYKYTRLPWYRMAVRRRGALTPVGPYLDGGILFYSFVKAFYQDGRLSGVASVDSPQRTLQAFARPPAGEYVYSIASDGRRSLTAGAAFGQGVPVRDMSVPVRYTGGRLHLVADRTSTIAQNRRTFLNGLLAIVAIWTVAALMSTLLIRSWRVRRKNIALQIQQVALQNEIALRAEVESHLRKAAYADALTRLPNRAFVVDTLRERLRSTEAALGLLFLIDVDAFSMMNDTLGHASGDQVLNTLSARLQDAFPAELVARLGGDEFIVLMGSSECDLELCAGRIREVFAAPIEVRDRPIHLTASLGAVWIESNYAAAEDILKDAEIAMYSSKRAGRGGLAVFEAGMRRRLELDAALEHDLRQAIQSDEFTICYQPIIDLRTRAVVSLEALVRWIRPAHGLTHPADFIPYAEAHGMVSAIDALVMRRACEQMHEFVAANPAISISVNWSMAHLTSEGIVEFTRQLLRTHDIAPSHLKLEITETSIMRNAEYALQSLQELRAMGVLTVVDDFGTGYSSLSYLQRLPIAGMKIDRSFVLPLEHSPQAQEIVRSIIALADALGLYTVAEGVETAGQLEILEQLGATQAQGFFFSPPIDGKKALLLLNKTRLSEAS